jgi:hypothetical protein
MLDEEDAAFEFLIPAYENSHNSSKSAGVDSNGIFGIGGEVVLLTAAQAELSNLLEEWPQFTLTDDEIGGTFTAIQKRAGASPVEGKTIGYGIVDTK